MATDSLGEYKVVVTADYSQLKSQFEAMSKYVSATTSTIADSLNKTMGGINASMIGQLKSATEQLKSSFNGLETATRKSGDGFQSYAKQIKDAEMAAQRCHQEITSLQNKMADSSVTDPKDVARLEQVRAKFREIREQTDQLKAAQADYNARIKETQNLEQMAAKAKKQADQEGLKALREREREQAKASQQEAQQIRKNAADRQRQINALNIKYRIAYEEINKYMQAHAKMSEAVFIRLQGRITAIGNEIRRLGAMPTMANPLEGMDYEKYTSGFSKLTDAVKAFKHHIAWMASAAAIGGIIGMPVAISKVTESFDALNTKIMQNMELASQYEGHTDRLHSDMNKMGDAAKKMAQGFGISVNEVQEGMQIITRRFKDADTAIYLTGIALQMSKLDMVDVKQSAKDLEAVMLQFGMGAKDAGKFLNDFSVICHVARISGTDMLMALERSGSAFKTMNMDARAAMAAIAAVSTVTGKSGATIGDSWKSILANMDFKKATAALEAYNIKLYEVGQNGAKTMRSGTAVLSEILAQYQKLDDEGRRKLATAIAGGKYQVNNMMAFLADASGSFNTFLQQMNEKSSDAMTAQLLAASMDTYETRLGQAKAAFENFGVTIGSLVLPHLKNFALLMTGLGQYLQQHAQGILKVVSMLGKLALAFLAVKAAMMIWAGATAIYTTIQGAIKGIAFAEAAHAAIITVKNMLFAISVPLVLAYNAATSATGIAAGIAAGGMALLNGAMAIFEALLAPIGVATLAIVAIIATIGIVAYEVYEHWETVSNDLTYLWNTLVEVVATAVEAIIVALSPFIIGIYALVKVVEWAIKEVIAPIFELLAGVVQRVIAAIGNWLQEHGITTQNIANYIRNIWNNFVQWLANSISPAFAQWLNDMVQKLVDFAKKVWSIANSVSNAIRSMFGMAQSAGENGGGFIDGIANSIKSKLNIDLLGTIADAQAGMKNAPYANAPSMPTGSVPSAIGGGGSAGTGKGTGRGAGAGRQVDNSVEAMGYRYLKGKGIDANFALGLLANAAHESSFNPDATNGNHWGMFQWDATRWSGFIDDYLAQRNMSQSEYYNSDADTKRALQYDYALYELKQGNESGSYQEILSKAPSTPEQWAHLLNMYWERSGVYSGGTDWERQKTSREYMERFGRNGGEANYTDVLKEMQKTYQTAKAQFDADVAKLKYERELKGERVTPAEIKAMYEKSMGVKDGKSAFDAITNYQKDYMKVNLDYAKEIQKAGEYVDKATQTQVQAIEKMADAEVAFSEKIGLMSKQDVWNYNYRKNESNYASGKAKFDAQLGGTVDTSKGTADDMLSALQGLIDAQNQAEAKLYADRIMWLSKDIEATKKALDERIKLEEKYQQERYKLEQEEFLRKNKYVYGFVDSFVDAWSSGMESILNRTKSFGEALRDMFKQITNAIIKMFVEDWATRLKNILSKTIHQVTGTGYGLGTNHDRGSVAGAVTTQYTGAALGSWASSSLPLMNMGGKAKTATAGTNSAGLFTEYLIPTNAVATATKRINQVTRVAATGANAVATATQTASTAATATVTANEATQTAAHTQSETTQTGVTVANAETRTAVTNQAHANVMANIGAMITQMLAAIAIMAVFSALFGGGGSSTSESTSSVNLGRSPDSYYMTPTPVMQSTTFTVPSMDIGGNIEKDMLIYAHKNEMVLTPEQADVIRSTAKNNGSLGGNGGASATVRSNINVSTVDSRGFDRVLRDYNRDLSKNVKKGIRNGYLNTSGLV